MSKKRPVKVPTFAEQLRMGKSPEEIENEGLEEMRRQSRKNVRNSLINWGLVWTLISLLGVLIVQIPRTRIIFGADPWRGLAMFNVIAACGLLIGSFYAGSTPVGVPAFYTTGTGAVDDMYAAKERMQRVTGPMLGFVFAFVFYLLSFIF